MRKLRRGIIGLLIGILIVLLGLEALLAIFDPWGMYYFGDLQTLFKDAARDPVRGYVFSDGVYQLARSTATVENGTRRIPAANPDADCTIVFLGDSVTFGHGVDDADTFANLLAQQFPDVYFINGGVDSYNSTNVLGTLRAFSDANGYLYLISDNDISAEHTLQPTPLDTSWLVRYLRFALVHSGAGDDSAAEYSRFYEDLDTISVDPRVALVAWPGPIIDAVVARGYPVHLIPAYDAYPEYRISYVDRHPNPAGHQFIAEHLTPIVAALIAERCSL